MTMRGIAPSSESGNSDLLHYTKLAFRISSRSVLSSERYLFVAPVFKVVRNVSRDGNTMAIRRLRGCVTSAGMDYRWNFPFFIRIARCAVRPSESLPSFIATLEPRVSSRLASICDRFSERILRSRRDAEHGESIVIGIARVSLVYFPARSRFRAKSLGRLEERATRMPGMETRRYAVDESICDSNCPALLLSPSGQSTMRRRSRRRREGEGFPRERRGKSGG